MSVHVFPPSETANIETVVDYFRQGRVRLNSAVAAYPHLDPAAALIALHQSGGRLQPVSARRYFEDDSRTLAAVLRLQKRRSEIAELTDALQKQLGARGRSTNEHGSKREPLPDRTSGLKVTDASEYEARTAFYELKQQSLDNHNLHSIIAALFVLVCCHSGLRPVEIIGASLNGTVLTLINAKRRSATAKTRDMDLGHLHPDVLDAVALMIAIMPVFRNRHHYVLFRNRLRQALQRACVRGGIRELSLYSFRHVAIATWKRAGMSAKDIARLAGHISLQSAGRHYAGAKVGHRRSAFATPATEASLDSVGMTQPNQDKSAADSAVAFSSVDTTAAFEFESMPVPACRPYSTLGALSPQELSAAKEKWAGASITDTATLAKTQGIHQVKDHDPTSSS